jgi:hypothetical protein
MTTQNDSVRAFGALPQTAIGTANRPAAGFPYIEGKAWMPNIGNRIPHYKTNGRLQERKIHITTRHDQIDLRQVDLDLVSFPILLQSGFGPPASGVYKFGTATNATPTAFLTCVNVPVGAAESWQFQDCRVNTIQITGDAANGSIQYTASILGLLSATQPGGAWAPTYATTTTKQPIDAWQVTLTKGGSSPGCLMNFQFSVDNHFDPLYCFPSAVPTGSTTAGLAPTRYRDGSAEARFNATLTYDGYTGSSFADFLAKTPGDWAVTFTDPTAGVGGGGGSLVIDMPNMQWITASIDESNPEAREVLQGVALYDPTAATSVKATLVLT